MTLSVVLVGRFVSPPDSSGRYGMVGDVVHEVPGVAFGRVIVRIGWNEVDGVV